ncbi:MAG TPA: hypothetical protein VII66_06275 [Gemmatimonadaceae bacterium]
MGTHTRSVALLAAIAAIAVVGLGAAMARTDINAPESVAVVPRTMPRIATVDERYESYNVEVAEVIGGSFWKPYTPASITGLKAKVGAPPPAGPVMGNVGQDTSMYQRRSPIDLTNPRLRKLASVPAGTAALAPETITFLTMADAANAGCR